MASLEGFDATKVAPATEFSAIPAGKYAACIVASEMKDNKAGTGSYLQLRLQITKGEHKNRTLFDRLNLNNPNQTAVQIAQGQLSAICRAVNVLTPSTSEELHNLPMLITVKTRDYEGSTQNEIKAYAELPADFDAVDSNAPETPW